MIQKIDLSDTGLNELSQSEIQSINGGGLFEWVGEAIGAVAHVVYLIATSEPIRPSTTYR